VNPTGQTNIDVTKNSPAYVLKFFDVFGNYAPYDNSFPANTISASLTVKYNGGKFNLYSFNYTIVNNNLRYQFNDNA